jgi:hypothetical protein
MKELFADSFVFFAILNPRDKKHRAAVSVMQGLRTPLVTTAWILTELADGLCAQATRNSFLTIEERLRKDPHVALIPATEELFHRGLILYRSRPDKDWSLTDCISFVVMAERGITDALTGDRHFEQAGFKAILR